MFTSHLIDFATKVTRAASCVMSLHVTLDDVSVLSHVATLETDTAGVEFLVPWRENIEVKISHSSLVTSLSID